jgi:fused signal recognition particle receptor
VDVAPEPVAEPEPIAEPEPVAEPEPEVIPEPVIRDEIAELLAAPTPVVKKSKPKQVRQAKKPEAKTITEDDIAAALGLGDDSDD